VTREHGRAAKERKPARAVDVGAHRAVTNKHSAGRSRIGRGHIWASDRNIGEDVTRRATSAGGQNRISAVRRRIWRRERAAHPKQARAARVPRRA